MSDNNYFHTIAILCKSCKNQWALHISLSGNLIEAFATICDCGALIVGNYNYGQHQNIKNSNEKPVEIDKKIYLTNGHFEILDLSLDEISSLPSLTLE